MNLETYSCLNKNVYTFNNYSLTPLRCDDIQLIREWRNKQIKFLRQEKPLTEDEQKLYFENTIKPSFTQSNPKIILFSFLENSKLIGYGGFVNINWKDGFSEISFLIEPNNYKSGMYDDIFSSFLHLLKIISCDDLKFKELYTETYDIRPIHIKILEKNGFNFKKRLKKNQVIEGNLVDVLFHSYICNI